MFTALQDELREVVWLASIVGGLSVVGVGVGVALALALGGWQHLPIVAGHV
jgi:hypothetical protein